MFTIKFGLLGAAGITALGLAACGSTADTTSTTSTSTTVSAQATAKPAVATAPPTAKPTAKPTAVPTPKSTAVPTPVPTPAITTGEANAAAAAANYLQIGPFSRTSLIQQLSSSAGDGYSVADATYGVNALHYTEADWDKEAAQAAKNYLQMSPFSCSALVQQLSSSAGDQYTLAQAPYGAHAAGAC